MMILIPKMSPKRNAFGATYIHACETLAIRAYLPIDYDLGHSNSWVTFKKTVVTKNGDTRSFVLSDFHVLDSEDISPLERVIYGVK